MNLRAISDIVPMRKSNIIDRTLKSGQEPYKILGMLELEGGSLLKDYNFASKAGSRRTRGEGNIGSEISRCKCFRYSKTAKPHY